MKALHPSDHEIKVTRVPGGTDNTVALCIDQTFTLPANAAAPDLKVAVYPNIACPVVYYRGVGGVFPALPTGNFAPPVFGGAGSSSGLYTSADLQTMMDQFDNFEAVRITSESLTVNFLAPATANQGTCTCAQIPSYPQRMYIRPANADPIFQGTNTTAISASMPIDVYDPLPTKSRLLTGTRAYTGQAKEGVYVPLRLSGFKWHHLANLASWGRWYFNAHTPITPFDQQTVVRVDNLSPDASYSKHVYTLLDAGHNLGICYFEGVDATAAYELRFRMTIEARVNPGSTYASMCEIPPLADELALKMYSEIASRMKNAYPASYNDWDQLKKTIKSIGRTALTVVDPLIHMVTAGLPMGGALGSIATSITDGLRRKLAASDKAEEYQADEEEAARIAAAQALKTQINKAVTAQAQKRAQIRKAAKQSASTARNLKSKSKKKTSSAKKKRD